jgi:hypothetical protein
LAISSLPISAASKSVETSFGPTLFGVGGQNIHFAEMQSGSEEGSAHRLVSLNSQLESSEEEEGWGSSAISAASKSVETSFGPTFKNQSVNQ